MDQFARRPTSVSTEAGATNGASTATLASVAAGPRQALNVPYGPHPEQRLDVFTPAPSGSAPLVMFVHGGGWSVGDKAQYSVVGNDLARAGIVTVLVNYRLSPAVQHPTHVQDVAHALSWCYRNAARCGADPERLCLFGHSSGAHLAALVALEPSYLAAEGLDSRIIRRVIGVSGVAYDLDERYAAMSVAPFFTPVFGEDASRWNLAAPMRYIEGSAPPFLLIHGLGDTEAPPASTEAFAAALRQAGVPTELVLVPDENHVTVMYTVASLVANFLQAA